MLVAVQSELDSLLGGETLDPRGIDGYAEAPIVGSHVFQVVGQRTARTSAG